MFNAKVDWAVSILMLRTLVRNLLNSSHISGRLREVISIFNCARASLLWEALMVATWRLRKGNLSL